MRRRSWKGGVAVLPLGKGIFGSKDEFVAVVDHSTLTSWYTLIFTLFLSGWLCV